MAVDVPPELINQYLMSNSVMRDPESIVQRILSLIFGRNILEQSSRALTGPVGSFVPFKGFMPLQFAGQTANTIVPNSRGADLFRSAMSSGFGRALNERSITGFDPAIEAQMLEAIVKSAKPGFPAGLRRVTPMDTSLRSGVAMAPLSPASPGIVNDIIVKLLSNNSPVGRGF